MYVKKKGGCRLRRKVAFLSDLSFRVICDLSQPHITFITMISSYLYTYSNLNSLADDFHESYMFSDDSMTLFSCWRRR